MRLLRWSDVYSEAELLKAALALYTKPLFSWRKALSVSQDGKTLYDFARFGARNLDSIHRALTREAFEFRPGVALRYRFNKKPRTLHIFPWEERLVDLFLLRVLNRRLDPGFSSRSFAYRFKGFGIDRCQREISRTLACSPKPLYVMKRDIVDFFGSIDHVLLLGQLERVVDPEDYLFRLLAERIRFRVKAPEGIVQATRGVPLGSPVAGLFANVYLTGLDLRMAEIEGLHYFRYADDFLAFSPRQEVFSLARSTFATELAALRLESKQSHEKDLIFGPDGVGAEIRHLGLLFRSDGVTALSRDKRRKITNIFRYAFRRRRARLARISDPERRARAAIEVARRALETGLRNVAIIDYYLRHVEDESQLRGIDRWLAEEVLSIAFGGGHRRGNFRKLSFRRLRGLGLPSLVHRRRLILHKHIESPFFVWKNMQLLKCSGGGTARPVRAFSSGPEAAALDSPRGREGPPVDGCH